MSFLSLPDVIIHSVKLNNKHLELERLTNNIWVLFGSSLQNLNLDGLAEFQDPGLEERFNLDEMSESLEVKLIEIQT